MKKFFLALIAVLTLSGCGVGSYSVSSGMADEGMLSFVSANKTPITVTLDNDTYKLYTVKTTAWKNDRDIKKTAQNTLYLAPGQHHVVVEMKGQVVCDKKVFISVQEHKIVEL